MLQKYVKLCIDLNRNCLPTLPSLLTAQNLTSVIQAFLDLSSNAFSLTGSSSNAAAASISAAQTPNGLLALRPLADPARPGELLV